jgi:hypothetical protein
MAVVSRFLLFLLSDLLSRDLCAWRVEVRGFCGVNMGEAMTTGRGNKRHQMVNTFVYLMVLISSLLLSGISGSTVFSLRVPFRCLYLFRRKEDAPNMVISEISIHTDRRKRREQRKGSKEHLRTFGFLITVYQTVPFTDSMPSDFGNQTDSGL